MRAGWVAEPASAFQKTHADGWPRTRKGSDHPAVSPVAEDTSAMRKLVPVLLAVGMFAAPVALRGHWTGVSSAGTIDEGDLNKILLNNDGSATIRTTISSTSAKIRFNVTADPDITPLPPDQFASALEFSMRFRDNGPGARVIATLKRVALNGFQFNNPQVTETLATIDSDASPASEEWQTGWGRWSNGFNRGLKFLNDGYVVEVQIIKNNSAGTPGVMGVQVYRDES
jgi:hypothetical protein